MHVRNPEKFQTIAVSKKSFDKSLIFQIETANISCDEIVKLLGVDIGFMLNFDCHIKNVCKKAVQQLNILRDRPFNLKGGVMVFCFVQNFFFGQHKS